jgi:hypothetical protein
MLETPKAKSLHKSFVKRFGQRIDIDYLNTEEVVNFFLEESEKYDQKAIKSMMDRYNKRTSSFGEMHRPNLAPEDIAEIIREGREENDKKFDTYKEYLDYTVEENNEILRKLGSDYDENGKPYWNK